MACSGPRRRPQDQDLLVLVRLLRSLRLGPGGDHRLRLSTRFHRPKNQKKHWFYKVSGTFFDFFFVLGSILVHLGLSWPPRRLQDAPKSAQDASKSPQDAAKTLPRGAKKFHSPLFFQWFRIPGPSWGHVVRFFFDLGLVLAHLGSTCLNFWLS